MPFKGDTVFMLGHSVIIIEFIKRDEAKMKYKNNYVIALYMFLLTTKNQKIRLL
jgi:hypothetical protein